jgi:hypothetical protein
LQDRRFNPIQKSIVHLCIDVVAREEESGGEKQVSARDVICCLQRSHSALSGVLLVFAPLFNVAAYCSPSPGPAKLGIPYRPDPSYIEYFAQFADANNLENCEIHPALLLVASSKLEIIVENVRQFLPSFFLLTNRGSI